MQKVAVTRKSKKLQKCLLGIPAEHKPKHILSADYTATQVEPNSTAGSANIQIYSIAKSRRKVHPHK